MSLVGDRPLMRVNEMVILGSMFSEDSSELSAMDHRIEASWVFWK